jgi:hypothetical protein
MDDRDPGTAAGSTMVVSIDTGWANCCFAEVRVEDGAAFLQRWDLEGISTDSIKRSSDDSKVRDDHGIEVGTIRRTWEWLEAQFAYSVDQRIVVLIERVVGVGLQNSICMRVADVATAFFHNKYPNSSVRMVAPNSRIAFTKRAWPEDADVEQPKTYQRYSQNKMRSVTALLKLIDADGRFTYGRTPKTQRNFHIYIPAELRHKFTESEKQDDLSESLIQVLYWMVTTT